MFYAMKFLGNIKIIPIEYVSFEDDLYLTFIFL